MKVDIYIREKSGKREIRIPLLPEEIVLQDGDTMFIGRDIMYRGEVSTPSGTELNRYSWESEFPGILRKNDPMLRGKWRNPSNYTSILRDWKKNGTMLNLLVTSYPVNADVYIKEFTPKASGPFGDIAYEILFVEARTITIHTTRVDQSDVPKRQSYTPDTYHVVLGDDIWTIAERYYGDSERYIDIYNANKEIIEKNAKAAGFASSENGHWLCGDLTLRLP